MPDEARRESVHATVTRRATIDVLRLIDELEMLVENGKGHMFGKVFIDEQSFFIQTSKLKKALPDDLKKAERVTRDSDRVVSHAQNEAQRMVQEAQAEAQRLVADARGAADRTIQDSRSHSDRIIEDSQQHAEQLVAEHVITQRAQQVAEETHLGATQDAQEMRAQADGYAFEVLDKAGAILEKLGMGIEQGKEQIRQTQH
jgi:cell division septum initiation protein DivIVA